MNFEAFSEFIVDRGIDLFDFMMSNLLTASIFLVLILLPKLFRLFERFVKGR